MANMEEDLRAAALADAGIAALVRRRIEWDARPQGGRLPALTLHRISSGRSYTQAGRVATEQPLVQFDCWGRTPEEARQLRDAVLPFLDGLTSPFKRGLVESETPDPSPPNTAAGGAVVFCVCSLDVRITWKPAA